MAEPCDIFISFKNLDATGQPTRDSMLAEQVYRYLTSRGLNVFFSNVSLEKLGVAAYKRTIDDALDAARVLIAVGTSTENLDSQWVRYEWDSFYNDILSGVKPEGKVFVYVEDAPISSLPRALRQSQTFAHGGDALEHLGNFVANALGVRLTRGWAADAIAKRYGEEAVGLAEQYPFLARYPIYPGQQDRVYRPTGRRDDVSDKEAVCRRCGAAHWFDRGVSELPATCPGCGYGGTCTGLLYLSYSSADRQLVDVVARELELQRFTFHRGHGASGIGPVRGVEELVAEMGRYALLVCVYSSATASDEIATAELRAAQTVGLPIIFLRTDATDIPDTTADGAAIDPTPENGPNWSFRLLNAIYDRLPVRDVPEPGGGDG